MKLADVEWRETHEGAYEDAWFLHDDGSLSNIAKSKNINRYWIDHSTDEKAPTWGSSALDVAMHLQSVVQQISVQEYHRLLHIHYEVATKQGSNT